MEITRTSEVSGVTRTKEIDVTLDQLEAWAKGAPAQRAFPGLSASDREFIMSGTTDEEWKELFGDGDD